MRKVHKIPKHLSGDSSVFILANGPSILNDDLSLISNKNTIGMNGSTLLAEKFNFKQNFYVLTDRRFLLNTDKKHFSDQIRLGENCHRVVDIRLLDLDTLENRKNTYYVNPLGRNGFCDNLSIGYFFGSTTTMLAIQLATYIGYKKIFLLGVDLNWTITSNRFYSEQRKQIPDEFRSVQMENILNAYYILQKQNIELINCSPMSLLRPYMPFLSFEKALNSF